MRHQSTQHDSRVLSIGKKQGSMELALTSQHSAEPCALGPSSPSTLIAKRFEFTALDLTVTRPPGMPYPHPASSAAEEDGLIRMPSFDAPLFQEATPELYTIRTGVPVLLPSFGSEIASSDYIRVYQFAFSYSKSPRKWMRFTLRITVSVESKYWSLPMINTFGLNKSWSHELPGNLTSMLEKSLASFRGFDQDSCLTVFLGKDSPGVERRNDSMLPLKLSGPSFQIKEYLQKITSMIYHWDCPRYPDRQFDQRPRCRYRPTNSFIVYLHTRWVLATRFGSDKFDIDRDLYILRALHHLKGAPGITPFLGVLLDENDIISGYLSELPAAGRLSRIMVDATQSGQPITWARRERWCRQIVQAVAQMHSQEYVVGFLGMEPDCGIGIASNDNAVLYGRFSTTLPSLPRLSNKWTIPPECKQSASILDAIAATPETDLYQLGFLLWRIAANKNIVSQTDLCKMAGCTTEANAICLEPHAEPVQLPSPDENIPQYFRAVIAECRWELPGRRLPAYELLKMFPSSAEKTGTPTNDLPCAKDEELLGRPEECLNEWGEMTVCSWCDEKTTHHFYHCSISDYDLCHRCFLMGRHCFQSHHHLREYSALHDEGKYYTSIKENGGRDVIII